MLCLSASTKEEYNLKIKIILKQLTDHRMAINLDKCVLNSNKISFLEYSISKEVVSPDRSSVQKILDVSLPTNI